MNWNRRMTLVLPGLILAATTALQAQTVDCTGIAAWKATTTYAAGAKVTYSGKLYTALVSTTNVPPDYCPACGWWQVQGTCGTTPACAAVPSVPTGLAAPSKTSTSVNLSWNASTAPSGCMVSYKVFQNGAPVATPTGTSAAITGLTANTSYAFSVAAVDAAGTSAASAPITVTTTTPCSVPAPIGLAASNITSSSVTICWTAVAPSAPGCTVSYRIMRNGVQIATSTTPCYSISGLAAGTSYAFTVIAVDGCCATSVASAALTVSTLPASCTAAPSVPTGLRITSQTSTSATLAWSASTAGAGCTITYNVYSNGVIVQSGLGATTTTLSGLIASSNYTFSVAAADQAGTSGQSAGVIWAKTCATAPSVPTGLAASNITNNSLTLNWSASTAGSGCVAPSYEVYQDGAKVLSVPTTSANISGLAANTNYTYTVASVTGTLASAQSAALSVKTTGGSAPVSVTITRKSSWSGGYGGQIDIVNLTGTAYTNWSLVFSTTDVLSLYNGALTQNGSTVTVGPATWSPTLAANATWTSGFGATAPGTDWHPPATATFNGVTVNVAVIDNAPGSGGATVATFADFETVSKPVNQITLAQGASAVKLAWMGDTKGPLAVATNYPELLGLSISSDGKTLNVTSKKTEGGRAGVRLTDTSTGKSRYFGIRIKDANGALPVFPSYVSVGVCSEDTDGDLKMFQDFGTGDKNRRADNRYVYLNGGHVNGWYTWTSNPGDRARTYIRNSLKYGLIPTFVWYNIPDGGESYSTDLQHIQDAAYMQGYFDLLIKTLAIFNAEAPNETIMLVMEPDFIGYMMQNSGLQPGQISAQVMGPAQAAGILKAGDPAFSNTLDGLVKAINHFIKRDCPQVRLGWQINVWSSPDSVPGGNLIKTTDVQGWSAGRAFIQAQAQKVAAYFMAAGITSKADFISFDKYGYDAGGADRSPDDPSKGNWFWNSDHWSNYLLYVSTLRTQTGLPVALWQLPVGHINTSLSVNPYTGGSFPVLTNTNNRYEDSCPTYFLGDAFNPGSALRQTYFAKNLAGDSALKVSGSTLTWGAHMNAAKNAGVFNLMFGDGVGDSTRARPAGGTEPTDGWWFMTSLQRYLANPVSLK